jgi:hypothetical protein
MKPYLERMRQEVARLRVALARLEHENASHKAVPSDHVAVRRELGRWIVIGMVATRPDMPVTRARPGGAERPRAAGATAR